MVSDAVLRWDLLTVVKTVNSYNYSPVRLDLTTLIGHQRMRAIRKIGPPSNSDLFHW